jgi:hypothetical protein
MEHAGCPPASLAGSRTGVFGGASGSDYARLLDSGSPTAAHYGTGSAMAVLANRLYRHHVGTSETALIHETSPAVVKGRRGHLPSS